MGRLYSQFRQLEAGCSNAKPTEYMYIPLNGGFHPPCRFLCNPGIKHPKKRQGHVLTLPVLLFVYNASLLPLFNLEIVYLRSVCSLTGTIPHIKIKLIRAGSRPSTGSSV